jgi:predicted metal-dependent hydrolase
MNSDGAPTVLWRRHPKARRITLRIDPAHGQLIVTLPPRAARAAGLALLNEHADWVTSTLAALPEAAPLQDGATIPIDGEPHLIRCMPQRRGKAWLEPGLINVPGEPHSLALRVVTLLRAEAKHRLSIQASTKSAQAGATLTRVTMRDTQTRWGSCSAQGALMFNWRIVMAPPFVQDYVVAHEVAHLRHLDHGPGFWALADRLSPHRQAAVTWLRQEGPRLLRVGSPAATARAQRAARE